MSESPKTSADYEVGYGRPPVQSRFQSGQSGNPAGKRKGHPTVGEIFMKEAARLVKVKRGDTVETITKHEAIVRRSHGEVDSDQRSVRVRLRNHPLWRRRCQPQLTDPTRRPPSKLILPQFSSPWN